MIIKENSWHYWLISNFGDGAYWRTDLCSYMRGFLRAVIAFIAVIAGCSLLAAGVGVALYCFGYMLLTALLGLDSASVEFCVGAVVGILLSGGGLCYVVQKVLDRRTSKPRKAPSLFVQYIKDRHNKVCRRIEFAE